MLHSISSSAGLSSDVRPRRPRSDVSVPMRTLRHLSGTPMRTRSLLRGSVSTPRSRERTNENCPARSEQILNRRWRIHYYSTSGSVHNLFSHNLVSMSLAKHWAFTLNNYTDDNERILREAFDAGGIDYLVYGKEVGDSGTPHLQGHVSFSTRKRLSQVTLALGQAHYTVCRSLKRSIDYAKKDGVNTEYGTSPALSSAAGKRSDLEDLKAAVRGGMVDPKELREAFSDVVAKYPRFVLNYVRDHRPLPTLPGHALYAWQQQLVDKLLGPPDPRTIYFVVDEEGNKGKSFLCDYLEQKHAGTQVMKCGKRDDMTFELDEDITCLVVDVSRSAAPYLSYTLIEDVKDRRVFSPKYESHTKRFAVCPHVVIMMNVSPDMTKLSEDRYDITVL
ncbi:MAG: putative viral replication protein [Cressdnaviricota sp.]|nr:MAG: putative viral replication protein [Cressdnaviricota sp.]